MSKTRNITTSVNIPIQQYLKIKEQEINLSKLVTAMLEDYFIETETQFELKEIEEELVTVDKEMKELEKKKIKLLANKIQTAKRIEEEEERRDEENQRKHDLIKRFLPDMI